MSKLTEVYMIHGDRETACIGGRVINWVPEKKRSEKCNILLFWTPHYSQLNGFVCQMALEQLILFIW